MGKASRRKRERRQQKRTRPATAEGTGKSDSLNQEAEHESVSSELQLVIETESGELFARRVAQATALARSDDDPDTGPAAEATVRSAAAFWGLPDFVLLPSVRRVGSGTREISDSLIVSENLGAVLQVKSRNDVSDDPEKERRWIAKAIRRAVGQGDGTIRYLKTATLVANNVRGRQVTLHGSTLSWLNVVIIDHDCVPFDVVSPAAAREPTVVLLRRDWEFLFEQLCSVKSVLDYIARVASKESPPPLGNEAMRYYKLAAADAQAHPREPDPRVVRNGTHLSTPLLPREPQGYPSAPADLMYRILLEDIARSPIEAPINEWDRIAVLSRVDSLPVGIRRELGALLIEMLKYVMHVKDDEIRWRMRSYRWVDDFPHLGFVACSKLTEDTKEGFRRWVILRHHELCNDAGSEVDTVAVLLTPRHDGVRPWDTTMIAVSGWLTLEDDDIDAMVTLWGRYGERQGHG